MLEAGETTSWVEVEVDASRRRLRCLEGVGVMGSDNKPKGFLSYIQAMIAIRWCCITFLRRKWMYMEEQRRIDDEEVTAG